MRKNKLFGTFKRRKHPDADPNCVMCKGNGYYRTIHCDDYDEYIVTVTCGCINRNRKKKEGLE